jgi:UDP-N-acetyl-D-glucosamine dehydrogenase
VLILGAAYKPDIGDTRESPVYKVIRILRQKSAEVDVFDPYVPEIRVDNEIIPIRPQPEEEDLRSADAVLILTNHKAFDYERIGKHADIVIDTRNAMHGIRTRKVFKL